MLLELTVRTLPDITMLPDTFRFPPTYTFLAIPAPPSTIKAPVDVLVDSVVPLMSTLPLETKLENVVCEVVVELPALVAYVTEPVAVLGPRFTVPANVGDVLNTRDPEPVSSDMTPANSEDVTAAVCAVNLSAVVVTLFPPTEAAVKLADESCA